MAPDYYIYSYIIIIIIITVAFCCFCLFFQGTFKVSLDILSSKLSLQYLGYIRYSMVSIYPFIRCNKESYLGLHFKLRYISPILRVCKVFYCIHLLNVIWHLITIFIIIIIIVIIIIIITIMFFLLLFCCLCFHSTFKLSLVFKKTCHQTQQLAWTHTYQLNIK